MFTIVYVGRVLHQNGRPFVLRALEKEIGDFINDSLLTAYYLFNIGYVFLTVKNWETIRSGLQLIEIVGEKTGAILLLLGLLHFVNILVLKIYADLKNIDLSTNKTQSWKTPI